MIRYQPFTYIELDLDYAGSTKTIRLCEPQTGIPVGELFFPCIERISLRSGSVNIGGADSRMSAFGERAELNFTVRDFPYEGRFLSNYDATPVVSAGTFFGRLVASWPAFSGAAARHVEAYLDGGVITPVITKHFILRNIKKTGRERYNWTALDPLDLAANENALAPTPSSGVLAADIDAVVSTCTLSPTGIGDAEYPASGRCLIGSEYSEFTRAGDVLTFTSRGIKGTAAASHASGDTVQVSFYAEKEHIDIFAARTLGYSTLDPVLIPTAAWATERQRWASTRRITTDIVKPTPVDRIMSEISVLGCSFWWNDVNQLVGFKTIRPPDGDTVWRVSDDDVKEVSIDFRDEDRITQIMFSTVQKTVNANPDDYDGYQRHTLIVDGDAVTLHKGQTRQLEVNCRLLNQGADTAVRQIARRLLKRRVKAPKMYQITLDAKDGQIGLTDVIELTTRSVQQTDGTLVPVTLQVVKRTERRSGHDFEVLAQEYEYGDRLFYIAPAGTPNYATASDAEKAAYGFIADRATGLMPNGDAPYEII